MRGTTGSGRPEGMTPPSQDDAPGSAPAEEPDDAVARIRVFLLDDHEVVRRGLRELLDSAGDIEVVGESGVGRGGASPNSRPAP